jgi:hypothetical protein
MMYSTRSPFPVMVILSSGNRKKSGEERSGEYRGSGRVVI